MEIDKDVYETIKNFLNYSLRPIHYDYDKLTQIEKDLCSKEEFDKMIKWVNLIR